MRPGFKYGCRWRVYSTKVEEDHAPYFDADGRRFTNKLGRSLSFSKTRRRGQQRLGHRCRQGWMEVLDDQTPPPWKVIEFPVLPKELLMK